MELSGEGCPAVPGNCGAYDLGLVAVFIIF